MNRISLAASVAATAALVAACDQDPYVGVQQVDAENAPLTEADGDLRPERAANDDAVVVNLMQAFMTIDTDADLLLDRAEWMTWPGWGNTTPRSFAVADDNESGHVTYGEYERLYTYVGDDRLLMLLDQQEESDVL